MGMCSPCEICLFVHTICEQKYSSAWATHATKLSLCILNFPLPSLSQFLGMFSLKILKSLGWKTLSTDQLCAKRGVPEVIAFIFLLKKKKKGVSWPPDMWKGKGTIYFVGASSWTTRTTTGHLIDPDSWTQGERRADAMCTVPNVLAPNPSQKISSNLTMTSSHIFKIFDRLLFIFCELS